MINTTLNIPHHAATGLLLPPRPPHTAPPREVLQQPEKNTGRAPGDQRSTAQITRNPLFDALNHLTPRMLRDFHSQVGGNWDSRKMDDQKSADIAANAERVLKYIDSAGGSANEANNNNIDGFRSAVITLPHYALTAEDLIIPGSEASLLQHFIEQGYSALHPRATRVIERG